MLLETSRSVRRTMLAPRGELLLLQFTGTAPMTSRIFANSCDRAFADFRVCRCRPILQIPLSFGPVVVIANLTPEFHASSTLQLSAPVTAAIFQGNITVWDHPEILALNPNLTCAHIPPLTSSLYCNCSYNWPFLVMCWCLSSCLLAIDCCFTGTAWNLTSCST